MDESLRLVAIAVDAINSTRDISVERSCNDGYVTTSVSIKDTPCSLSFEPSTEPFSRGFYLRIGDGPIIQTDAVGVVMTIATWLREHNN